MNKKFIFSIILMVFSMSSFAETKVIRALRTIDCKTQMPWHDKRFKDYSLHYKDFFSIGRTDSSFECELNIVNRKTNQSVFSYKGRLCLTEADYFYWKGIQLEDLALSVDLSSVRMIFFPYRDIVDQLDGDSAKGEFYGMIKLSKPQLSLDDLKCQFSYQRQL